MKKELNYEIFEDPRFNWIISSAESDVNDGLLVDIENGARLKFVSEANPDELEIKDYVKHLKREIKELKKYLNEAEVETRVVTKDLNELHDEYAKLEAKYYDEVAKPWYKKVFTRVPK